MKVQTLLTIKSSIGDVYGSLGMSNTNCGDSCGVSGNIIVGQGDVQSNRQSYRQVKNQGNPNHQQHSTLYSDINPATQCQWRFDQHKQSVNHHLGQHSHPHQRQYQPQSGQQFRKLHGGNGRNMNETAKYSK